MTKNKVFITDEKTLYSSCRDKSSVSGKKTAEMSKRFEKSSKSTNCEFFSSTIRSDLTMSNQCACVSVKRPDVPAWLYINAYRTMGMHGRGLALSVPNHGTQNPEEAEIVKEQLKKYHEVHEEETTNYEPITTKFQTREVNHG